MNGKRGSFAAVIVAVCCLFAFVAGASNASAASQKAQQQASEENVEGTSSFHELIFEKDLNGAFTASGHKFVVTPQTAVVDRYGAKTSLSLIKPGSIVRVRYRQENDKDPMTAVKVVVRQGPGE